MFENENLVAEEAAENTEQTVEETPEKKYSEAEFNAKLDEVLGKKIARREAKIRKEYERKYGDLENVLKAGTGKQSVEDLTDTFAKFYESKGIKINKPQDYNDKDVEVLARAEADEIIRSGYDEVVEETDRLSAIGVGKMTAREKAVFKALAEHRQSAERDRELTKIGVGRDVYDSQEFKDFAGKFSPSTPITDIYDIYQKTQPKKHYETMGSMKQTPQTGAKDYYTPEEIARLTEADLADPKVWDAVRRSMTGR
jgi:hypothetical protein